MTVRRIPNTNRQMLTASNGGVIERNYVYLPAPIWSRLQELARSSGTSVSQIIESFAISGTVKSKESNDSRTNTAPSNAI